MIALYICVLIIVLMIAYAGIEETIRVFGYLDLQLRFAFVRFRMYLMRKKLEKELMIFRDGQWKSFNEVREDDQK